MRPVAAAVLAGVGLLFCAVSSEAADDRPVAVQVSYAIYALGFRAMLLQASISFDGDHYDVSMSDHTVGIVGALITNRVASEAVGTLSGDGPHPSRYRSAGYSRGADRQTVIDYVGRQPNVSVLSPPEPQRDKVPLDRTLGSVDSLSAVAGLIRQIATSDRCDAKLRVFDGARLTEIVSTTVGNVAVPTADRSPYTGSALRCDFTTQLIGGFLHNANYARSRQIQHGTVWVAPVVPGGPPVPIQARYNTVDHGPISIYLQKAERQGA